MVSEPQIAAHALRKAAVEIQAQSGKLFGLGVDDEIKAMRRLAQKLQDKALLLENTSASS